MCKMITMLIRENDGGDEHDITTVIERAIKQMIKRTK